MKYLPGLTVTKVLQATYPINEDGKPALSKKAEECIEAISGNFGCQAIHVAKVASILLGEDICPFIGKYPVSPFTAVVLLNNPNSHNYPIRKVLIVKHSDVCVTIDGTEGNLAPFDKRSSWRKATVEEIKKAFKASSKKTNKSKIKR
jgi:hypothetical protein